MLTSSPIYNLSHLAAGKSIFVRKERFNATSALKNHSKVNDFYIRKTEYDGMTEKLCGHHTSALVDYVTSTGHSLKWDHFEILAKGRSGIHCKIKGVKGSFSTS